MSKLLTVFGATGAQGGALVTHVLQHPKLSKMYKLRGITRDDTKPAAISLKEKGVEVVKADMNDEACLEKVVQGSYAVFSVTNFWEQASAEIETRQGVAIADACVAAGVSVIIWSSLPNVSKMSGGRFTSVHHFDSKARVEEYIKGLPIISVFYWAGWYMQNFQTMMKPKPKGDGTYAFTQPWSPTTQIPLIDIRDTGKFLTPAILDPPKYHGKIFMSAEAFYTPSEIASGWARGTGKTVTFEPSSEASEGSPGLTPEQAEVLLELRGFFTEFSYFGPEGKEGLEWTLAQMEEKPGGWEEYVRGSGPWFE